MAIAERIPVFLGATASTNGSIGLVPAPLAGQENYVLSGSGAWVPSGEVFTWVVVTGNTNMVANTGYLVNGISTVTLTLPATFPAGAEIKVVGYAGGWIINQNSLQAIHWGNTSTTTGTGGHLTSTNVTDSVDMVAINANTDFVVASSQGEITVT